MGVFVNLSFLISFIDLFKFNMVLVVEMWKLDLKWWKEEGKRYCNDGIEYLWFFRLVLILLIDCL